MKTFNKELMLAALAGACLSLALAVPPALADPGAGELGADWYQWQATYYPDFSFGEDCGLGQRGNVWFLGGTGGGDPVVRECYDPVPAGKRLFFPLVNLAAFNEPPENLSVDEKRMVLDDLFGDQDTEEDYSLVNLLC